jgi:hypothetical protein
VRPSGLATAATTVLVFTGVGGSTLGSTGAPVADLPAVPQAEAPPEYLAPSLQSRVFSGSHAEAPRVGRESAAAVRRKKAGEPRRVNGRLQPPPVDVPRSALGRYDVVEGAAKASGRGSIVRYLVEVEDGLPFDGHEFADEVHRILNHERGWGQAGRTRFVRVDGGDVAFRVSLSSPDLTDEMCAPLRTFGQVSCYANGRAVINALRWGAGAETYEGDVASYREYLISHEVGHGLGHGHVNCPEPGALAPVMVQQTKSLQGCRPNPWPYPAPLSR